MNRQILGWTFLLTSITAASLLSVSCHKDQTEAEWWQGEQGRIRLVHQLELKQYRVSQSDVNGFEELKRLTGVTQRQAERLDLLVRQLRTLNEELAMLEGKWVDLRTTTLRNQRNRAIGQTFKSLESASGRKFQEVSVAAIDDAGVTIRHANGSARLRFADLSPDQQVLFGLDAELASAAEEREAIAAMTYERGMERQLAATQIREKNDAEDMSAVGRNVFQGVAKYAAARMPSPLAKEATPIGRRFCYDFGYYPRYRYRHRSRCSSFRNVYYYKIPNYYSRRLRLEPPQMTRAFGSH
jgi:hypothetical protein